MISVSKILPFILVATGCKGSVSVGVSMGADKTSIDSLDRLSAKPGESVTVLGSHLSEEIKVIVGGIAADFQVLDSNRASVQLPPDMGPGLVDLTFSRKSKAIASLPLINENYVDSLALSIVPLESICDSFIIKTQSGELQRGEANCAKNKVLCAVDGQADCKTTTDFPAVIKKSLGEKVIEGRTVAGIAGTAVTQTLDCQ